MNLLENPSKFMIFSPCPWVVVKFGGAFIVLKFCRRCRHLPLIPVSRAPLDFGVLFQVSVSCLQISLCFYGATVELELSEAFWEIFLWLSHITELFPSLTYCYLPQIAWNADTRSLRRPSVIPFLLILLIFYFRSISCLVNFLHQKHVMYLLNGFRLLMGLSHIKGNDLQILSP